MAHDKDKTWAFYTFHDWRKLSVEVGVIIAVNLPGAGWKTALESAAVRNVRDNFFAIGSPVVDVNLATR